MKRPIKHIDLELNDYFEEAFKDGLIPANSYIDKSKTGLGMTYSEFHALRHSLIVIPSLPIIDDKLESYKYMKPLKVWDKTTDKQIKQYIDERIENNQHLKIITTPEGMKKVIDVQKEMDNLNWFYTNVFCLLDEGHCYATDAYRKYILIPFRYFWKFDRKAIGTATPYPYSDARFNDLRHYKIRYAEKFGMVTIVNHAKPMEALNYFLSKPKMFVGKVHIFFNSVKLIRSAIKNANLKLEDVNVFCSDDEANKRTLGEFVNYFRLRPTSSTFKKFNFYSCRYNEGWDLFDDENATMILVTDTKVAHSMVEIQYKGFQAIGRLRSKEKDAQGKPIIIKPHSILHITNTLDTDEAPFTFEQLQEQWFSEARVHVAYRNEFWKESIKENYIPKPLVDELVSKLSMIINGEAVVHPMKVDQLLCRDYCLQSYFNSDEIAEAWKSKNYDTVELQFDIPPIDYKGKSNKQVNSEVVALWELYKSNPEQFKYGKAERSIIKLQSRFKTLHLGYQTLGRRKLVELNHDEKEIKKELVTLSNSNIEDRLKEMLCELFVLGERYSRKEIKKLVQVCYEKVEWKKPNGNDAIATAESLREHGYDLTPSKKDSEGNQVPSFLITKKGDCNS
ncbi:MAG: hypothetical protein EOO90_05280 [Pedobacter sp.]|nr:MAG: hypothetical protein EOO90_05280 [Pedobacter sp.]